MPNDEAIYTIETVTDMLGRTMEEIGRNKRGDIVARVVYDPNTGEATWAVGSDDMKRFV